MFVSAADDDFVIDENGVLTKCNGPGGDVIIPKSVTSIGFSTSMACTGLTSITIPSSVTSIGDGAFGLCSDLTSITISDSVTDINLDAFRYYDSLIDVFYSGTKAQWEEIVIRDGNDCLIGATIHCQDGNPNEKPSNTLKGKIVYHDAYNTAKVTLVNAEAGDKVNLIETAKDGTYTIEDVAPIQVIKLG